jgi:hypothetical protein
MVGGGDGGASERPMRRSRMLSDDARLALQLQDEELKAARGMKRVKHAAARETESSLPVAKKAKAASEKRAGASAANASAARGKAPAAQSQARGRGAAAKSKAAGPSATQGSSSRPAAAGRGAKTERAGVRAKAESQGPARSTNLASETESSDSVTFRLEPWPSAQEEVPPLRGSRMTLQEDQTVISIKRRVVEEAYPGTEVSRVEIRTPTGIKCGQDHSLKYVRTFLWPASKGDLVLYYCQAADSFL